MFRQLPFFIWFVPLVLVAAQFTDGTKRDLVRSLIRLNQAVGPKPRSFNYTVLAPIFDVQDDMYADLFQDDKESIHSEGKARSVIVSEAVTADIAEFYETVKDNLEEKFKPPSGVALEFGVGATKYEDDTRRVIVFHGLTNQAAYHDMMLSKQTWFLNKMKDDLKTAWLSHVGALPDAASVHEQEDDMIARMSIMAGGWSLMVKKAIRDWGTLDRDVDWRELLRSGYWPLVKEMVREWMPADRDLATEKTTIFTGHSQGGTYAQMVSMWLEKTDDKLYDAYAFNAPGVQCSVRYSLKDDYSADMDVTVLHPQIWQYAHALDPISNMDFTAGKVCKFGTTDLATELETPTQHFCGKIIGYSGAKFVFTSETWRLFQQCLYFTHTVDSTSHWLRLDSVLANNGETDGGCTDAIIVPTNPQGFCPPCASDRCVEKMPRPTFDWLASSENPCVNRGDQDVQMEMKTYDDTADTNIFKNCLVLGRDAYILIGTQVDSATGWSLTAVGFHYSLSSALPVIDMRYAIGLAPASSDRLRTMLFSPEFDGEVATPVFDASLRQNQKYCSPALFGVNFCTALGLPAGRRVLVENSNSSSSRNLQTQLMGMYFMIGVENSANGVAVRLGDLAADQQMSFAPPNEVDTLKVSRDAYKSIMDFATADLSLLDYVSPKSFFNHQCVPPSDREDSVLRPLDAVRTGSTTCVALDDESSFRVSVVSADMPPLVEDNNCYSSLRAVIAESFEDSTAVDAALMDDFIEMLFLSCSRHANEDDCAAVVNDEAPPKKLCVWRESRCETILKEQLADIGLYSTDFNVFIDEIEACSKTNAAQTHILCESVNDETLWPNIATTEDRKLHIKRALHYTLLIDKIIIRTRRDGDSYFIQNILYASLDRVQRDPTFKLREVANPFEIAKFLTISSNVRNIWVPPEDCCVNVPGSFAFKGNVMEAAIEDFRLGYPDNAYAGIAMAIAPTRRLSTTKQHKDLYATWNMAFVSHYPESPYFYAKLMTPQVLCADAPNYLYARVIGLYVHLWATLISRSKLSIDPNAFVIVPNINWENRALTARWGEINKMYADVWLQQILLPSSNRYGQTVRADLVYSANGKMVSSVLLATLKNGPYDLIMTASIDGLPEIDLALDSDAHHCLDLIGGLEVCFHLAVDSGRRNLQAGEHALDGATVTATISGMDFVSPHATLFAIPKTHPCFTDAARSVTEEDIFTQNGDCTVLGSESYLTVRNGCNDDNTCQAKVKVVLAGEEANSLLSVFSDQRRALSSFSIDSHALRVELSQSGSRLHTVIFADDEIMFDVELETDTSQCIGTTMFSFCVARVSQNDADPEEGDQLILSVKFLGIEREMLLSRMEASGKMAFEEILRWGAKSVKQVLGVAKDYDPCADVVCAEGEMCAIGRSGQNPCYPSLFLPFDGANAPLVHHLLFMGASPYANFAIDIWEGDGWTLRWRECVYRESNLNFLLHDTREDCMLMYSKLPSGQTTPVCTLAFEGSDDPGEIFEAALSAGRVLNNGYWTWRGVYSAYLEYKKLKGWEDVMRTVEDPTQCSQVYLTGHSVGASIAAMFRLDYGFGRLVGFAMNNLFPPGFTPTFAMGDSFRYQLDWVQSMPPGWVSGGVREYSMCQNGNVMERGLNPKRMMGGKDFCEADLHRVTFYTEWFETHVTVNEPVRFGQCENVDWIARCVEKKCGKEAVAEGRALDICTLGSEALRASMMTRDKMADAMHTLARVPSLDYWKDAQPFGACGSGEDHDGGACVSLGDDGSYMNFTSTIPSGLNVITTFMDIKPWLQDVFLINLDFDPNTGEIHVRFSVGGLPIPIGYTLPASSHYCPEALSVPPIAVCVVYDAGKISLALFLNENIAYTVELAVVSAANGGSLTLDISPTHERAIRYASRAQMFASHSGASRVVYPLDGYCNKITSQCLEDNTCESWRGGAECSELLGVCTCGPGLCSNSQGVCVSSDNPTAFTLSQQPCIGPDDAFTPMVYLPDPSNGDPYDRCVILSDNSYIRFDFPTAEQASSAILAGVPLSFRAKFKLGVPSLPISFERVFALNVTFALAPEFTAFVEIFLLDDITSTTPDAVLLLASDTFTITEDALQELCSSLSSTGLATISLFDVCLVISPATPVTVTGRQLGEQRSTYNTNHRSLVVQNFCSTTDVSDCQSGEVCKSELSVNAANCTDVLKNCVCVDMSSADDEDTAAAAAKPVMETNIAATVQSPTLTVASKRRVPLAAARSDGNVEVLVPAPGQEMVDEQTSEVPVTWLTPSIIVLFAFLCFVALSVSVGLLCPAEKSGKQTQRGGGKECKNGDNVAAKVAAEETAARNEGTTKDRGSMISRVKNKMSPVQFARDFNAENSRISLDQATWTFVGNCVTAILDFSSRIIIRHPTLRMIFCNSFLSHLIRLLFLGHDVNSLKMFAAEEVEPMKETQYSSPIRKFLCWRRSVMIVVFVLSTLILFMGLCDELPRFISEHLTGEETPRMSNEELSRTVKLMAAFGGTGQRRRLADTSQAEQHDTTNILSSVNAPLAQAFASATTGAPSDDATLRRLAETQSSDLSRARDLISRMQNYASIMYGVKLFVSLVSMWTILRAAMGWVEYRASAWWTRLALFVRVSITVLMTLLPWWYFLFGDDREFPAYMKSSAKLYMAFLVNVPLFTLSFMVTPAVVKSSMIVIHLMPYTILPYMVITIGPVLAVVALWPMLSVIGHGSINWLFLYGALIYSCYACITAFYAFRALESIDALRGLGKRTFHNARKEMDDEEADFPTLLDVPPSSDTRQLSLGNTVPEEGRSWSPFECNMEQPMPTLVAPRKTEPVPKFDRPTGGKLLKSKTTDMPLASVAPNMDVVDSVLPTGEQSPSKRSDKQLRASPSNRIFNPSSSPGGASQRSFAATSQRSIQSNDAPSIQTKSSREDEKRRTSTMLEFERFASEKILNRGSELKVFKLPRGTQANANITDSPDGVCRGSIARGSMEITELLVEGTLMANLRDTMQPSMRGSFFAAQMLYFLGLIALLMSIVEQSSDVFEVMINGGSVWGYVASSMLECFVNKILLQMIFADFLLNSIVKLRLFNGYMSDDTVLTDFVSLQGYAVLLTEQFRKGVQEEEMNEEKRRSDIANSNHGRLAAKQIAQSTADPSAVKRRATRSQSVPDFRIMSPMGNFPWGDDNKEPMVAHRRKNEDRHILQEKSTQNNAPAASGPGVDNSNDRLSTGSPKKRDKTQEHRTDEESGPARDA